MNAIHLMIEGRFGLGRIIVDSTVDELIGNDNEDGDDIAEFYNDDVQHAWNGCTMVCGMGDDGFEYVVSGGDASVDDMIRELKRFWLTEYGVDNILDDDMIQLMKDNIGKEVRLY